MRDDVMVVIRSSYERTEAFCYDIIAKQVPTDSIVVIHETPFSEAVRKTFRIGFESKRKWTLAVDADILLSRNAIDEMIARSDLKPSHAFIYQGCVLDKLFNGVRAGGPHLYRSNLLQKAQEYIPVESENLRPESYTYTKMAELGYHFYQEGIIYGIHDYEQYLKDIYRKSFIHAKKHLDRAGHFLSEWTKYNDEDYNVAITGFFDGLTYKDEVSPNAIFFEKLFGGKKGNASFPKERMPLHLLEDDFVSKVIQGGLNEKTLVFLKKHTKSTYKSSTFVSKVLGLVGSRIESLGRSLK